MMFWQYDASVDSARLASRLMKYKGGQILVNTRGETLQGEIARYEETCPQVKFHLGWLARKVSTSDSHWYQRGSCRWELLHTPALPEPLNVISCAIVIELQVGEEHDLTQPKAATPFVSRLAVAKFYQNKEWHIGRFRTRPKCLFFSTTIPGERGILFQPHDPRNLRLENGKIIDPCTAEPPVIPPK